MRRILMLLALALAGAAAAHAELLESTPAAWDIVSAAPQTVTLTFTEGVEAPFSVFKVYPLESDLDPADDDFRARLNAAAAALVGEVLTARDDAEARADAGFEPASGATEQVTLLFDEPLLPGHYVVMWRALSVDTHVVSSFFVFTVAE